MAENERRGTRTPGSVAGPQQSSRRSVLSLKSFTMCMKVKFALEQPSGTGVGHELASAARSCMCYGNRIGQYFNNIVIS